jgi:cyclic pyranopterin phosphate synthase
VRRINILLVLDTLKADRFRAITRWGDFSQVMAGIEAAERVGFNIKLNVVKGVNEDEYDDLIRFAHRRGMDLTLIETMRMVRSRGEVGRLPVLGVHRIGLLHRNGPA